MIGGGWKVGGSSDEDTHPGEPLDSDRVVSIAHTISTAPLTERSARIAGGGRRLTQGAQRTMKSDAGVRLAGVGGRSR